MTLQANKNDISVLDSAIDGAGSCVPQEAGRHVTLSSCAIRVIVQLDITVFARCEHNYSASIVNAWGCCVNLVFYRSQKRYGEYIFRAWC